MKHDETSTSIMRRGAMRQADRDLNRNNVIRVGTTMTQTTCKIKFKIFVIGSLLVRKVRARLAAGVGAALMWGAIRRFHRDFDKSNSLVVGCRVSEVEATSRCRFQL